MRNTKRRRVTQMLRRVTSDDPSASRRLFDCTSLVADAVPDLLLTRGDK